MLRWPQVSRLTTITVQFQDFSNSPIETDLIITLRTGVGYSDLDQQIGESVGPQNAECMCQKRLLFA
jgi:hypothetical protein